MGEWLSAALVILATVALMPALHRRIRRSSRGKLAGGVLALGVVFSNLLDPAKRQATEEIEREKGISGARTAARVGGRVDED